METKRAHTDYVSTDRWFAWYPVRTIDGRWVFWNYVNRTVDDRPLVYQGLLTQTTYEEIE